MDEVDWPYIASLITAVLAFCSPAFAMLVARSTVRYAPYSYAFGLTSCALWISFGLHYELGSLCWLSSFGALAYAGYLAAFIWISNADDPRRDWLLRYVLGGSVAVLLVGFLLRVFASQAAFDNYCSTVAGLASLAPLWNLAAVYRTKTTDSMPSHIVAGLLLLNASISVYRNIHRVERVNLNLTIPAGIALFSAAVQLLLHITCCCLPQPPLIPSAVDRRPLLLNQAGEDDLVEDNETRVDVDSLKKDIGQTNNEIDYLRLHQDGHHGRKEIADANNKINNHLLHQDGHHGRKENTDANSEINNLHLHQDGQHGRKEITGANNEIKNLPLHQEGQHGWKEIAGAENEINDLPPHQDGHHGQQEIAHANSEMKNLQLPQDGHHGQQEIAHADKEIKNLQLPQDSQGSGEEEKKEEPATHPSAEKDKDDAFNAAEVKPPRTVTSDEKVDHLVD